MKLGLQPAKIDFREAVPTDPAHVTSLAFCLGILPNPARRNKGRPARPYAETRIFAPDQGMEAPP